MENKKIERPNIDYSKLKYRPQHLTIGTSEENSFYLQEDTMHIMSMILKELPFLLWALEKK